MNILWFDKINKNDISKVGGKGANLGEMFNNKIPVPEGFCVTAQAYEKFIEL
ncbi:MAG: PEP/pyruvate-binding domain-containing protein, partial [Candidatus Woesearchaeota archaeon]